MGEKQNQALHLFFNASLKVDFQGSPVTSDGGLVRVREVDERGVKDAIRIPANENLERDIAKLLTQPVGRPSHKPVVWYKGFLYEAASWKMARRVLAKVEFHFGGTVLAIRFCYHESEPAQSGDYTVLQQAGYGGAMDQGWRAGKPLDPPVVPAVSSE
jgi:hypothetical protein